MESKRCCQLWLGLTFYGKGRDRALLSLGATVMHLRLHWNARLQYRQRSPGNTSWSKGHHDPESSGHQGAVLVWHENAEQMHFTGIANGISAPYMDGLEMSYTCFAEVILTSLTVWSSSFPVLAAYSAADPQVALASRPLVVPETQATKQR